MEAIRTLKIYPHLKSGSRGPGTAGEDDREEMTEADFGW